MVSQKEGDDGTGDVMSDYPKMIYIHGASFLATSAAHEAQLCAPSFAASTQVNPQNVRHADVDETKHAKPKKHAKH